MKRQAAFPDQDEIRLFLEHHYSQASRSTFIPDDPVSIPHRFTAKEDIEVSGFFTATISWGQRKSILRNAESLMQLMEWEPHDFILSASPGELKRFDRFVHRTFNAADVRVFVRAIRRIYDKHGGIETLFSDGLKAHGSMAGAIHHFREIFFSGCRVYRTFKHVSDPLKGSSCKRINMYLRWMVRSDASGVDFGIWKSIPSSSLMCPLDVHSGRVARKLGLLRRKQDDWKAVEELTNALRAFDAQDPVRFDFALFGAGVKGVL